MLSFALTSSEQINQSFGEESKGDKPKETKSDSKPKDEDKSKKDTKSKGDGKSKNRIVSKENHDDKGEDIPSKSTDNPSASLTSDTSTTSSTSDSDAASASSTNQGNPITTSDTSTDNPTSPATTTSPTTLTAINPPTTTPSSIPLTTAPLTTIDQTTALNENLSCPDGYHTSPTGKCKLLINNPSPDTTSASNSSQPTLPITKVKTYNNSSSGSNESRSFLGNTSQLSCNPTNVSCSPINPNVKTRCPDGYHMNPQNGLCHFVIPCDPSKKNCPILDCSLILGNCPNGITCKNNYHMDLNDGLCHYIGPKCVLPKEQCPPLTYDPIPYLDQSSNNDKKTKGSSTTNEVIKFYITNPIIQQQVAQQPANVLIPMDTLQFCNLIGDHACVFMNSNFKILFNQTTQDNLGNWVLNGEAQNIGANPINNVMVVWHLYDAFGNIVGLTQGYPIPSSLGIGQTTIFNLQKNPTSLTGVPKFYRISFVY